jgi:hypothetical protein
MLNRLGRNLVAGQCGGRENNRVDRHQLMRDDGDGHHGSGLGTNARRGIKAAAGILFCDRRRDRREAEHEEKRGKDRRQSPYPRASRRQHAVATQPISFAWQVKEAG